VLEQLGDSNSGLPVLAHPAIAVPSLAGVVVATAIAIEVRRRLRARDDDDSTPAAEKDDLSAFPILPSRRQRLALEEL
jgi:hypothetical protein